ncbi:MAG: AAA family ATPase [Opitutaceae bacterium]|jgi:predicted ATPase|nr:AAA family ATPase [Opitutaceae bacterium]
MKAAASFIRSEGGLLPADLLARIRARDERLPGLKPVHYGLVPGETLNEAASRSWARLTGLWRRFAQKLATRAPEDGLGADTLDLWLRPLFQELGFPQPLERARAETLGRDTFAISHRSGDLPIHFVGAGILLDKRTRGVRGAADVNPHGLLQDYLNRKDAFVWGLLSNGLRLRLLRDNAALTRQAFVEFDLEAIFSAEDQSGYADFFLLWLICHRTRFAPLGGGPADAATPPTPASWIIEQWRAKALESGQRANERLRANVVAALNHLAEGFIGHRKNHELQADLRDRVLSQDSFKRQLLRLTYRLLFLFVAEDRGVLLSATATPESRERYIRHYSTARLRLLARRYGGTAHGDGWAQLQTLFRLLQADQGCPALGLPALGGFLFSPTSCPDLDHAHLANEHLYSAFRALVLARAENENVTHLVDYEHLGAEELGSVYESLLELRFEEGSIASGRPRLIDAPGNDRKLTGSYYTPTELITSLLDTALQPVIDRALASANPRDALLALKIVDPACGSGHFLVAAAHRLARALAAHDTDEREPPLGAVRHALHEIVGRCLYGVDFNPLSVELCKVSLWLEAIEPGRPLNFLESHIQCGNSLLGCTPRLLREGLPDEAFKPIAGDDPEVCKQLRKDNRDHLNAGQELLALTHERRPRLAQAELAQAAVALDSLPTDSVIAKDQAWKRLQEDAAYRHATLLNDAWCAAFVIPKQAEDLALRIHTGTLRRLERNHDDIDPRLHSEIRKLAGSDQEKSEGEKSYRFFHWHLRFPAIFRETVGEEPAADTTSGWSGGFDVVLGNPPWERVKLQEQEWFANQHTDIAQARTAAERKTRIEELRETDPDLHARYREALRKAEGESHLLRNSGRYPLCGRGDVNTYSVFAELITGLISPHGRTGFIVPTGIATDDGNKFYFQKLVDEQRLVSLYDFENKGIFPTVDSRVKFSLITLAGTQEPQPAARFFFFAHGTDELADPACQIELTPDDIKRINPNTRTCPIFRTRRDAEITRSIYARVPVLLREAEGATKPEENPWDVKFTTLFHMSNASHLFYSYQRAEEEGWERSSNRWRKGDDTLLPLYEAKLLHHFDHRWATYQDGPVLSNPVSGVPTVGEPETRDLSSGEKIDPDLLVTPRYWIDERHCLVVAAEVFDELRDAVRIALAAEREDARPSRERGALIGPAQRLRREIARWLSGWRTPEGSYLVAVDLLRDLIALDGKKRSKEAQWAEALSEARRLAVDFPLTADEALVLRRALDAPLPEQVRLLSTLFRVRTPKWFLAFRDIARATDERTAIFATIPWSGVGNKAPVVRIDPRHKPMLPGLVACLSSFVHDFATRQKIGGTTLNFFLVYQFPVLPPETYAQPAPWSPGVPLADWLRPYVLELCYTAHDLRGFAEDCGFIGAPFRWNDARRALLRAELDAAFFHLYGLDRDDTAYVLDTFTVLKNCELRDLGRYETADRILAAYDAMAAAIASDQAFTTLLDPPPADPSLTHDHANARPAMPVRITRATVRNYRSLAGDSAPVSLDSVTVLVGPNGSGKSSFCDALAFLADAMAAGLPTALSNGEADSRGGFASLRKAGSSGFSIRVEAESEGIRGHYELELAATEGSHRIAKESAEWRVKFEARDGEWTKEGRLDGVTLPPNGLLLPLLQSDPRFADLASAITRIRVYRVPPIVLRQPQDKGEKGALMDSLGRNWPTMVDAILKGPRKGSWVVALNRLTDDIADARVQTIGGKQIVEFQHREPGKATGGRWAPADQESDGTLRAAALLAALVQDPLPSLIAIEEPELAIHPGALEILYDFIHSAQRHSQVILTTHSPDLLDHFEPELLRVVTRTGDTTRITAMEEDQFYAAKERLRTLGEILRHEPLRAGGVDIPVYPPKDQEGAKQ